MTAALLSTPYCVDYDLVILGPAMALLVSYALEKGFAPYEISLLALVWIMPLAARLVAGATLIPLGPAVEILFFVWIVRRSRDAANQCRGASILPPLYQAASAGK
jgi:alpha-1,2-mannosyltransferase